MTKEKELLLQDLSARLPYGVKLHCISNTMACIGPYTLDTIVLDRFCNKNTKYVPIDEVKPYLFPLSSMTDEQKQEYTYIVNYISSDDTESWKEGEFIYVEQFTQLMYFYHINHFDYRGLIEKGLAIDATDKNIY